MTQLASKPSLPSRPEPTWDIAKLFPLQGHWSVDDYLELNGNYLVEFSNGTVEVLDMPTDRHQAIVAFLYEAILMFIRPGMLGVVRFAPIRLKLNSQKVREPDVMLLLSEHDNRRHNEYWEFADLVVEVVSADDRRRDLDVKRVEYADAGIPEYWIVDPQNQQITVLSLSGKEYQPHGTFRRGQSATSALLQGLQVSVEHAFDAR